MIKTRLGRAVIMITLIGILIAAVIYKYFLLPTYKDAGVTLTATENALASPDLVFLSSIDLDFLRKLEARLYGKATLPDLKPDTAKNNSIYTVLQRAITLHPDTISTISAAAYLGNEKPLSYALVAGGNFITEDVIKTLKANAQAQVHPQIPNAWTIQTQDIDSCQMSKIVTVIVTNDKIIALDSDNPQLLERLQKAAPAERDLTHWREFRKSRFIAAAVFLPQELPQQGIDPFIGNAAKQAKQKLGDFNAIYLGAANTAFPPGGSLALWLTATSPAIATDKVAVWQGELAASRKDWEKSIPTLAALHDHVKIKASGNHVQTEAQLNKKLVEDLGKLPGEIIGLIFSEMGMSQKPSQMTSAAPAEVIDKNPRKFTDQFNMSLIPPYDPKAMFAEAVDVSVGPFGIQLTGVRLTATEPQAVELDIKAMGANLPNLSDNAASSMALSISSVRDKDGKELLRAEPCGRDRNSLAAHPSFSFGSGIISATKKVRLHDTVRHTDVASIAGNVQLSVPTQIETIVILNPKIGDHIEREALRVEITKVEGGSISYRVSGKIGSLLHMQAKNAKDEFLASGSASSMSGGWDDAKSTSIEFKGKVASLVFTLAKVSAQKEYPFELKGAQPQAKDTWPMDKHYKFDAFTKAEIKHINVQQPVTPKRYQPAVATAKAGPAIIDLDRVSTFGDLQLNLSLYIPLLKNMNGSMSAAEIEIQKLSFADGSSQQAADGQTSWRVPVAISKNNQDEYVSGRTELDTAFADKTSKLASVAGQLWLNLPLALENITLPLTDVGAQSVTTCGPILLTEIARGSVTLEGTGDPACLFAIRALNVEGKDMRISNTKIKRTQQKWQINLSLNGLPNTLEFYMLKKSERLKYPFTLTLGEASTTP